MEQEHQEPQNHENILDTSAYSLLERAIRLLRKNTHYQFYDEIRGKAINISYGQVFEYPPPKNEHALKIFWRCLITRFFKKIEDFDIEILKYCHLLVNNPTRGKTLQTQILNRDCLKFPLFLFCDAEIEIPYWSREVYLEIASVLRKPKSHEKLQMLDYANLMHYVYLEFLCVQTKPSDKKLQNRLRQLRKEKHSTIPKYRVRSEAEEEEELGLERVNIKRTIQSLNIPQVVEPQDELTEQILRLEAELEQMNEFNKLEINKLSIKANDQIMMGDILYIINTQRDKWHCEVNRKVQVNSKKAYMEDTQGRVQLQLKYLEGSVLELEHRQAAESIAKVYPKNKGGDSFGIVFEKGGGLIQGTFSLVEFARFQKLREFSLTRYYPTSIKTKYSSMCNLISAFQILFKRKSVQPFKNKDFLKQPSDPKDAKQFKQMTAVTDDTQRSFESLDMCHHCKQLYEPSYMVRCSYHSATMGPPSQCLSFIDPYIQQIFQRQGHIPGRAYLNNERNAYMSYHQKGNEYVCYRKYCQFCLKHSYEGMIDENGMCPFCQGICFCSRCLRNDTIVKLKTLYALMGGDVRRLNSQSLYYKLSQSYIKNHTDTAEITSLRHNKQEVIENSKSKSKSVGKGKGKGRGKGKRRGGSRGKIQQPEQSKGPKPNINLQSCKVTLRQFLKLQDIRQQLQQCRQICQIVKRREKQKLFIVQNKEQLFIHLVNDLDMDFKIGKRPRSGDGSTELEEGKKVLKKTKLIRK